MGYRYLTDDGEIFETEKEAKQHVADSEGYAQLDREVGAYLDAMEWKDGSGRARTRLHNSIMAWIRYDRHKHPGRYSASGRQVVDAISGLKEAE